MPYVSASGNYNINMLVPGCTNFQDCALRTSVKVTVFPGNGLNPSVTTISQQNTDDATKLLYSGPVVLSSTVFATTITMMLADDPAGTGQNGKYELVADRIQMVLTSVDETSSGSNSTTTSSASGTGSAKSGFGFFEWPLSSTSTSDATQILPNSTETFLDAIGSDIFNAAGGNSSLSSSSSTTAIVTVAHHSSGTIFLGGNFTLTSGTASSSSNIVAYKSGALAGLANNGLNGPVTSFALDDDSLYVGGSFTDTSSSSSGGTLRGIALYNVQQSSWSALKAGVNGDVTSLVISDNILVVAGNFTKILTSASTDSGIDAAGVATWNISSSSWVNSGGFLVGSMSFVGNGTSSTQFIAGSVTASQQFGATGMVLLKNGASGSSVPSVTPLGIQLDSAVDSSSVVTTTSKKRRRAHIPRGPSAWISHINISHLFSRQSTSTLAALPADPAAPAPAVLAGTFWTNGSSSVEVAVIGGNFSFTASSGSTESQGVALYDPDSATITALQGSQINGTVRSLLVDGDQLYVGGQFTLEGTTANGLAIYDLSSQQWDVSGLQPLQASSGSTVVVRSISVSASDSNTIIIAGSFSQAGSLPCQAICSFDKTLKQWNRLGNGIQGEVSAVSYAGVSYTSISPSCCRRSSPSVRTTRRYSSLRDLLLYRTTPPRMLLNTPSPTRVGLQWALVLIFLDL